MEAGITGFDEWDRARMESLSAPEPVFFDGALTYPPRTLLRRDGGDTRWYYCPELDRFFPSVTSVLQKTMPTPAGLIHWMMKHGSEAETMRDERAAYGTWLHVQIGRYLVEGSYDLDALPYEAYAAATLEGADPATWYNDAKKDMLAFVAFAQRHRVRPLAIELMLCSEEGYAGCIDLVCEMRIGSGAGGNFIKKDEKTGGIPVTAIIDFKSGRKGFYEKHEIQLHMYRRMWEENFDIKISRLFNWSPKDWRSYPTFNLKDQTEAKSAAKIPHLLDLFAIDGGDGPGTNLVVRGTLTPDCDLSECYAFEDAKEAMRAKAE